jgi:two-component system chemotaxis response regulator CheB
VRVLVIDDSSLVREILSRYLSGAYGIEVVGAAVDAFDAGEKIPRLRPDVLTLDVEMPRMNGIEFLRRLMPQYPLPVIMVSASTTRGARMTLDALALGAVDVVAKPSGTYDMTAMLSELALKIRAVANANVYRLYRVNRSTRRVAVDANRLKAAESALPTAVSSPVPPSLYTGPARKITAIGASTGGSEALKVVLANQELAQSGLVIAQHMPPGFTALLAERLSAGSPLTIKEAADGEMILNGTAFVAPGGMQLRIVRDMDGNYRAKVSQAGQEVYRPSVGILFTSVAEVVGKNAVGAILTGMGNDGAEGLLRMRKAGARCFGQDQETSVVFGMPSEALRLGAVERLAPINEISQILVEALKSIKV